MSGQFVCPCNPTKSFASASNLRRHGYKCSIYLASVQQSETPALAAGGSTFKNKDIACSCGWKPTARYKNVTRAKCQMHEDLARHVREGQHGCRAMCSPIAANAGGYAEDSPEEMEQTPTTAPQGGSNAGPVSNFTEQVRHMPSFDDNSDDQGACRSA